MGFKNGAYATVWDIQPRSPKVTVLRISTSKKPHGSDEYVQDFSGFCSCVGETAATAAKGLKVGERIKLGDVETTTSYIKEKDITYTNFAVYSFERVEKTGDSKGQGNDFTNEPEVEGVDDGEVGDGIPW